VAPDKVARAEAAGSPLDALATTAEVAKTRNRDQRGAAARLKLARKVGSQVQSIDKSVLQMIKFHNESNQMAVDQGVPDLPYLEELVDTMRSYQQELLLGGKGSFRDKGARQQSLLLAAMMKETERRNRDAHTNIIAKVCAASKVQRKPSSGWHIISGTHKSDAYLAYKCKKKNRLGQAENYGLVIICYDDAKESMSGGSSKHILSIMQRADYTTSMLVYTCLECLQNMQLSNLLLRQLQQLEVTNKVPIGSSKHIALRECLMDIECQLHTVAKDYGRNRAVKCGHSITAYDLEGLLAQDPAPVMQALFATSQQLREQLLAVGSALKELKK